MALQKFEEFLNEGKAESLTDLQVRRNQRYKMIGEDGRIDWVLYQGNNEFMVYEKGGKGGPLLTLKFDRDKTGLWQSLHSNDKNIKIQNP